MRGSVVFASPGQDDTTKGIVRRKGPENGSVELFAFLPFLGPT